jgi:metal-responsive CopG/Arc/MetJ family transcriptional regulator
MGEKTMSKKVLVALPENLLKKVDFAAQSECRTRSDLIREALRRYLETFQRSQLIGATAVSVLEQAYASSGADQT